MDRIEPIDFQFNRYFSSITFIHSCIELQRALYLCCIAVTLQHSSVVAEPRLRCVAIDMAIQLKINGCHVCGSLTDWKVLWNDYQSGSGASFQHNPFNSWVKHARRRLAIESNVPFAWLAHILILSIFLSHSRGHGKVPQLTYLKV